MKHNTNNEFGLKEKDKKLLENLNKVLNLEKQRNLLNYYGNKNDFEKELRQRFDCKKIVLTLDDLLSKYEMFNITYNKETNIITLRRAIPVNIFTLFRREAEMFGFDDILVITDPYNRDHI